MKGEINMKITYVTGDDKYKTVECKAIDRTWNHTILIWDGSRDGIEIRFDQLVGIEED